MRRLALLAWGLLFALLGVGIGLVVFRPWDHHVALSLSGSYRSSPIDQANASPSAGNSCQDVIVRKTEQLHTIPRNAWVHASDGVNVRAAPSSSATRLTTLATGTVLTIQQEQTTADGSTWYRIRLSGGRDGWLVSRFTTNYPISLASTDSLKIWLPDGYQFSTQAAGTAQARYPGAALALLYLQSGARGQAPAEATVPAGMPRRSSWTAHATEPVLVGDLPATDHVFGISGCPAVVHEVRITTTSRFYDFIFLLDAPSSSVVAQLLDSATVQ